MFHNITGHTTKSVLLIGAVPPPFHGSNVFFKNLLDSKLKEHFEIIHLDTSDHRSLDNLGRFDYTNVRLGLSNILQFITLLARRRCNIVYVPVSANLPAFCRDAFFVILASVFTEAKIVIHMHAGTYFRDVFYDKSNIVTRWFIRSTLQRVDTAIVVGECLRSIFSGLVREVVVVPNGTAFDPGRHATTFRKSEGTSNVTVGFLGNLIKSKGILDLLEASKEVKRHDKNVKFKFAGAWWGQEPDTREIALRLIEENCLQDTVEFIGVVSGKEKERFLLSTDIFVFPTYYEYESFGLVNIEAMAAGCPVISTRVGAIPEVVVDGVTGILVEKQNPQQLADAIIRLVDDPELRQRMGEAGRKRFEEHYTFERCAERLIKVFEQVLQERSAV